MKKILLILIGFVLTFSIAANSFAKNNSKTIVYYFWAKPRCVSCKKIETYTQEAISENFAKELKSGLIEYKVIDFSKDESYVKKYKIFTKSVILSEVKNGKEVRYKNLDKIWLKLGNKEDFKAYIKTEIKNFKK